MNADNEMKDYELNMFDDAILSDYCSCEFCAISHSLFTKWHINDVGTIPRWSKYSKLLDDKRKELINNER